MSTLGWILVVVATLVAVLAAFIAAQPAKFTVRRTASIAAPPQAVFAQVNDFHNWRAWSPWEQLDPEMKRSYDGPQAGTGAKYAWAGNKNVGEGRMTITESRTAERVLIDLEFIKPFAARNTTEFVFRPEGGTTAVSWTMTGHNNFMGKAFSLFMNVERMVGGQFEQGLSNMKKVVERHG